ncbi:MAG: RsfS/YbeB/iojap family protein, partial [Planctomycetes bacterium]|nr:RsfS/YbeB/iojap family protein [Planctomycetota bacterium]
MACALVADGKKGEDIVILDVRKLTYVTDYFVIGTGFNPRQLQSIADES